MKRDPTRLQNEAFDVLIIGGGINGAGLANLASLNHLKVALIEKYDFAYGTSSRSTKLLHGGLRYLENFEFGLVKEALRERSIHLKSAPHLVRPLRIVIPVYKKDFRPLWMMKFGVSLYGLLSGKHRIGKNESLSAQNIIEDMPQINQEGLVGGVSYFDVRMDDARLVLENVLQADQQGAVVNNYIEVLEILKVNGKAVGVKVLDRISKEIFEIKAKKIVACVGPWTNILMRKEHNQAPLKLRTTKGVHLIYNQQLSEDALFVPTAKDGRMFFIIPWMGTSMIGTTDTDYTRDPDDVSVLDEDIEYLFKECRRYFPEMNFREENILSTFAGLRPLVAEQGKPSKISRKHKIETSYTGLIYVMGGKYTTYRKIAAEVMPAIYKKDFKVPDNPWPLYGGGEIKEGIEEVAQELNFDPEVIENLMTTYGPRYTDVLELVHQDINLSRRIIPDLPFIQAQVEYAKSVEMAQNDDDVARRRLPLNLLGENLNQI